MSQRVIQSLNIGDLKAKLPIVQGGMGIGVSLSRLASAVANEGGIGVIAAAGIGMYHREPQDDFKSANIRGLKAEIKKARSMTNGILGVNIMVALQDFSELVTTAIQEGIDVIFAGAGLALDLPKYLTNKTKTKLIPIVSSGRAALLIAKKWFQNYKYLPDGFVLEGPKAGGHLGFKLEHLNDPNYELELLLKDTLKTLEPFEALHQVKIPIIAAGGIYDGHDIKRLMDLGASGVQMASRFVTTVECDASQDFKQAYIEAKESDIDFIISPVGLPGRAIINPYLSDMALGKKKPFKCPYHCIITCKKEESPYCISLALFNAQKGRLDHGFAFAGANAWRATEITTVPAIIAQLKSEMLED